MKPYISAVWSNLLVITYEVDKNLLRRFIPAKTELPDYKEKYLLSIVAFIFSEPAFRGFKMPFFKHFPEINLRFYVKSFVNNEWKTGVVFIKEISPSRFIGVTAKLLYNENFITANLNGSVNLTGGINRVKYDCNTAVGLNRVGIETESSGYLPVPGSIESFICDQYLAFTSVSKEHTLSFEVRHRPWRVFRRIATEITFDPGIFQVKGITKSILGKLLSSFMMDGSYTEISRQRLL